MSYLWLIVDVWSREYRQVCEIVLRMLQVKITQWSGRLQTPFYIAIICILNALNNVFLVGKLLLKSLLLLWLTWIESLICFCWVEFTDNDTFTVSCITNMDWIFQYDGSQWASSNSFIFFIMKVLFKYHEESVFDISVSLIKAQTDDFLKGKVLFEIMSQPFFEEVVRKACAP